MELLLILFALGAILLTYQFCQPLIMKRTKARKIKQWIGDSSPIENRGLPYDFAFERDGVTYHVKVIVIPKYAEIIINAKTTWELRYGAGNTPGKVQPIKKYLPGIGKFMNYQTDEQTKKIVVLTPDAKKKVKYINENEMVFVGPETNVYGIQLLNESEFKEFLHNES
ncbi:MAG: hypothetical protein PHG08_05600 [Bacilli bacterium]|jgi:hypothetical protein|nr:hypothetical protein [Bacilli bacterium]HHU24581.1 hypothetical protein [Acholeplasmataceae bacterium]